MLKKGSSLFPFALAIGLISVVSLGTIALFGQKSNAIFIKTINSIEESTNPGNGNLPTENNSGNQSQVENSAPVFINSTPQNGGRGSAYSYVFEASDSDNDVIQWSYSGTLPTGLTLNTETGELSGTPTMEGIYNFSITITDTINNPVTLNNSIEILGCTDGPIGTICGDGYVYAGVFNGLRTYFSFIDSGTETQTNAVANCNYGNNMLATMQQFDFIAQNLPEYIYVENRNSYWSRNKPSTGSTQRYYYLLTGINEWRLTSSLSLQKHYFCVRPK